MKGSERHKLKHDKAAETMVTGLDWARHHLSTIIAVFVALLVIIGGSYWLAASRRQAAEQSAQMLEDARRLANGVLNARAQGRQEDMATVVRQFDQIASDNANNSVGAQALLSAGELQLSMGKPEDALQHFEKAFQTAAKLPGIQGLARRGMAEALEAMGNPQKAIEQYMEFAKSPFDPEAVRAWWDIGRCYEELKDREKAEESYRKTVQYGEKTEWANLASFRLSELAGGAELLGPATTTTLPPSTTTTTLVEGATTTTVAAPAPAAPEKPAVEAPAQEKLPPPEPADKAATPEQKPDGQAQP